jgi:hypothetical protein
MGRLYGQRSRLMLNSDAVFLAELVAAVSPDSADASGWAPCYRSRSCFSLPRSRSEMPLLLQIASSITLLLADFTIRDALADRGGARWRLARRLFAGGASAASEWLTGLGFPVERMARLVEDQSRRERDLCAASMTAPEALRYAAASTAEITGLVFMHSAAAIGCDPAIQVGMLEAGRAFGALVYLVDALVDYEEDSRRAEFNALAAAFGIHSERLKESERESAAHQIDLARDEMARGLRALPIPDERAEAFIRRLDLNLKRALQPQSKEARRAGIASAPFGLALAPAIAGPRNIVRLSMGSGHGSMGPEEEPQDGTPQPGIVHSSAPRRRRRRTAVGAPGPGPINDGPDCWDWCCLYETCNCATSGCCDAACCDCCASGCGDASCCDASACNGCDCSGCS